jgi:hypothetical protein
MTVREFVDLALSVNGDTIKIYDNEKGDGVFKGIVCDLQDDILDRTIGSWNIEEGTICLNVD